MELPEFRELLISQLARFWKDGDKVAVIKLSIQAAKVLSVPEALMPDVKGDKSIGASLSAYPAVFFMVADVMTYFGNLVYDRLGEFSFIFSTTSSVHCSRLQ